MPERDTADARLDRWLQMLPMGSREEGATLDELARAFDLSVPQVLRDLEEMAAREFYHPAGSGDDIQILIEPDHVEIWTKGEFRRPVKLSPREALALDLGLRALARERGDERLLDLARRLEAQLAVQPAEALRPRFELGHVDAGGAGVLGLFRHAVSERRRCRIRYLSSGAAEPTERIVCPFAVAIANGQWYVIGHCSRTNAIRIFRHDRILEATMLEDEFEVPADFDVTEHLADGRVFHADETVEVVVRYSPRIARWIRERLPAEPQPDGSVIARHDVADPQWAVCHVLGYGPDAEVLEPAEIRAAVVEAVERLLVPAARGAE